MQPLNGLFVLDFTTLLPGPLATLMLAEAGAEVLKIEQPGGENARRFPPFVGNESAAFAMLNRVHEYVAQAKEPPTYEQLVEQLTKIGQKTIDEHRNKKGERLDVKVPLVVTGRYRHAEDVKINSATTLLLWETANDFTPRRTGVSICWASSPEISEIATAVMRLKELDYLLNNSPLAVAQALEAVRALVAKLTTFVSTETNIVVIGQGEEHALLKGQMLRLPNAALNFG